MTTLVGAALLATPSVASAQYQVLTAPNTYTQLSSPTILTTDADDSSYAVTSPFPIRFYENTYTTFSVGSNGAIILPSGSVSLGNVAPGSTSTPNNFVAPFWDDQRLYAANAGYIGWEVLGTAPNRIMVVEWFNLSRFGSTAMTFSMQVRFHESGGIVLDVDYGPMNGTASFTSTMGMEDSTGANPYFFHPSSCTTSCNETNYRDLMNQRVSIGVPAEPQLTGSFTSLPTGIQAGMSGTAQITLSNAGTNTATAVSNNLWLSTDATLDASDALLGNVVSDIPFGDTVVTAPMLVPAATPPGTYVVILEVDANNSWPELNEANNVVGAGTPFSTSYDVQPMAIRVLNASGVNAGETLMLEVDIANTGIPYMGTMELDLSGSVDLAIDPTDSALGNASVTMTGVSPETFQVSVTLPTLSPGAYHPIVTLDPNNLLVESNELNNQFLSNATFDTGPDFLAASVVLPASVVPGTSANIATTIDSVAVAFTGNVPYRLYASADDSLDTAADLSLGLFNAAMAGEASLTDTEAVLFPASMARGNYYVFAVIDPTNSITEVTTTNNQVVSATTIANAEDFAVSNVASAPTALEIGDDLTVTANTQNNGVPFTGNVPFSIYLSPDATWDPGDQAIYNGLVFFPGTATGSPINVTLPLRALPGDAQIRPGGYSVIVRVDSTEVHTETDEVNNAAAGGRITLEGSDLLPVEITAPGTAFIGLPLRVSITVENQGVADANGFTYSYFLSTNDIIRVNDQRIFTSAPETIATGGTQTFEDFVTLPALTSTACLWLGVIVNDRGDVAETNINNNTRRIVDCIEIIFPIPDMTAQIISTPTVAAAGEEMAVTRLLNNIGTADAASFSYTYYLSNNPTISTDDVPIGTFTGAVPVGGDDYGIDIVQVPSQLSQGNYFVGLIVDPDDLLDEVIEDNNTAVGPVIPVFSAAIRFTTDRLPNATLGVDYDVGVYAAGAPLALTWTVSRGNLPDGLSIAPSSGIISGQPVTEGLFEFVLRASAGTAFAEKPYSIRVVSPTVELRVATPSLPTAISGRAYSAQLVAVGGQVPYTWAPVSDLPVGLELSEDGLLSGTPVTPGDLPITVRVRDELDNAASKELVLNVINANQSLQIIQTTLPGAVVELDYCVPEPVGFTAQNGTPPYAWSVVGNLPPGMTFNSDGELCGTPTLVGQFPITVRVQDMTGLYDTSLFIFDVDDGTTLAVSTFGLDNAKEGEAYEATLTAIRGAEPYTWSLVAGTALPDGLSLSEAGVISGTPSKAGTFAFVVQVTDDQLRVDVQPLSLTVEAKPAVLPGGDDGCTCVTNTTQTEQPWGSMAALFAMGGFFMLRRRRRTQGLLGAATIIGLLLSLSGTGFAQLMPVPGTPYQMGIETIVYAPLTSPTILSTDVDDGQAAVTLPFPFKFYDTNETSVSVGYNGAIAFPSGTSISLGNSTPGSTAAPNAFIAPFWDDLRLYAANSGYVGTQVGGTAPNRTFTIEYHNISRFGSTGVTFSMRVVLFEGPAARFDVEYGPMNGSAAFTTTMACEDQAGARAILFAPSNCTTSCTETDFRALSNKRITVIQDPGIELSALSVTAPEFAFLGAETPIQASVQNLHGAPLGPFQISIEAATDELMSNPVTIGTRTVSLQPFQVGNYAINSVFPASLGQTRVWLRVNVDSSGVVNEVNENNNSRVSASTTRLLQGAPDISVERVTTDSDTAAAGGTITVFSRLRNVGGEVATNAAVAVMLSTNPVISRQDVQLDTWNVTLNPGQTVNATTTVTIPAGANSGVYYLGTVADPENLIVELNESNNGRASLSTVTIAGGPLAVSTSALPRGYLFEPYVGLLLANGANPPYTWEISSGMLPAGLGLVPGTGELFGRPSAEQTTNFTVKVTSSDGQEATKALSIVVGSPDEPLTIVTRSVPAAVAGQEYAFQLVVVGGSSTSSLSWSLSGQPQGFSVTGTGVLVGTPEAAGTFDIALTVSDGQDTATRSVSLEIKENATLLIVPSQLPEGTFNEPYSAQLSATGGITPITWLLRAGTLPAGIDMSPTGEFSGTPTQVGDYRLVIEARDAASGGLAAKDENTFILRINDTAGFEIVSDGLPDGVVNEGYDESVAATGGLPPYEWKIIEGRLQEGLLATLDLTTNEFRIAGAPSEPGRANLLIQATDAQGRTTQRAFAIEVLATRPVVLMPTEDGGCTSVDAEGPSATGWLLLGLAGVFFVVRRRR